VDNKKYLMHMFVAGQKGREEKERCNMAERLKMMLPFATTGVCEKWSGNFLASHFFKPRVGINIRAQSENTISGT
jgi:hypothetical protein